MDMIKACKALKIGTLGVYRPATRYLPLITPHRRLTSSKGSINDDLLKQSFTILKNTMYGGNGKVFFAGPLYDKAGKAQTPSKSQLTADQILNSFKEIQDKLNEQGVNQSINNAKLQEELSNSFKEYLLTTIKKEEFNPELIRRFFLSKPSYNLINILIKSYYNRDYKNYIPADISMIPFREMIYNMKLDQAIEYMDLTTGSKRYVTHKKSQFQQFWFKYVGGVGAFIGSIHVYTSLYFPEAIELGMTGVYLMVITYFVNMALMLSLTYLDARALPLNFTKGTLQGYWYSHLDELVMSSIILTSDAEINGKEGFATREVVKEIEERNFEVKESEAEIMLRQYWMSNGDGFAWVEPDLDPAEIQWKEHLVNIGVKAVPAGDSRYLCEEDKANGIQLLEMGSREYNPEEDNDAYNPDEEEEDDLWSRK